jgi:methionyl-tRNA formyltransferase
MVQAMQTLATDGVLPSTPQDESLVTYAHKLEKSESKIDWQKSAVEISRQVRAFNPFPVATAQFRGETCRIWYATVASDETTNISKAARGEIIGLEASIYAACGQGALKIDELQMPGGKRQTAQQFIQGQHVKLGEVFS